MITDESEEEWADRVGNTAAAIATVLLIGILCYVVVTPLIFGHHVDLHATAHY